MEMPNAIQLIIFAHLFYMFRTGRWSSNKVRAGLALSAPRLDLAVMESVSMRGASLIRMLLV
jgi:hypothetical protein